MFDKYNDKDGCLAAVGMFLLMVILLAGLYLLEAWIGQWLWNDVVGMDTLFNLPELSFWQTYGLHLVGTHYLPQQPQMEFF